MNAQLYGGPQALKRGLVDRAADSMSVEYGDLRCCAARQQPFDMNMQARASARDAGQDDR
jgi:hypothetical protein